MLEKIIVGHVDTNCYLVPLDEASGSALVIDPGDNADYIINRLEAHGWTPKAVLLTHGHLDHIAGLPELIASYAERGIKLEIIVHKEDNYFLGAASFKFHCETFSAATRGSDAFVREVWKTQPDATRLIEEGDDVYQFKVLHVPGHTKGCVAFYDEKNARLFSGDTLFRSATGRTDLPESSHSLIKKSLARLFELPDETIVLPGHGENTTIGHEKNTDGIFG